MNDFKFIPDIYIRCWSQAITKTYPKVDGSIILSICPPIPEKADANFVERALQDVQVQIEQKLEISKHKKQQWKALEYAHKKAVEAVKSEDFFNACVAFMELGLCAAEINQVTFKEIQDSSHGQKARRDQELRMRRSIRPATEKKRTLKELGLSIGYALIEKDKLQQLRKGELVDKVRMELEQMYDDGQLNIKHKRYIPQTESIRKWFTAAPKYLSKAGPKGSK